MKTATFATLTFAALSVNALPSAIKRTAPPAINDTDILNFALTLEHLENAFYQGALVKYDDKAFTDAGFPSFVRGRYEQIADHEKTHVTLLTAALGDLATQPCEYSFPYTDPKSFVALSKALEGVGASAYTGAANLLSNEDFVTVAASILDVEARQASWISSAVKHGSPWSTAFETPLGLNSAFSLAAGFITSCPPTNPPLPVKAFPTLTIDDAKPGSTICPTFDNSDPSRTLFVAFFSGLDTFFVEIQDGKAVVPGDLLGTVYIVITTSGEVANDDTIIAGPVIGDFDFDSTGKLIEQ